MATERAGLAAGRLLVLGEEHRRGLHRTAHAECTRCLLERLALSTATPGRGQAVYPAEGSADGRDGVASPE